MRTVETFCPKCWMSVVAEVTNRDEAVVVRGESILITASIAVCPHCSEEIGDSRLEDENIARAYATYRERHGIVTPQQIKQRRERLGLSQKSLSILLDIGEASMVRYEKGSLPTPSMATMLKNALSDRYMREALASKAAAIPQDQWERASAALSLANTVKYVYTSADLEDEERPYYGNTTQNPEYIGQCIAWVVQHLRESYKFRIAKTLFYADFLSFESRGRGITGLAYNRMPLGPMPTNTYEMLWAYQKSGYIDGLVYNTSTQLSSGYTDFSLDDADVEFLNRSISFVNSFDDKDDLSAWSHELDLWKNREPGSIILYEPGSEVTTQVDNRLSSVSSAYTCLM